MPPLTCHCCLLLCRCVSPTLTTMLYTCPCTHSHINVQSYAMGVFMMGMLHVQLAENRMLFFWGIYNPFMVVDNPLFRSVHAAQPLYVRGGVCRARLREREHARERERGRERERERESSLSSPNLLNHPPGTSSSATAQDSSSWGGRHAWRSYSPLDSA